MTGGKGNSERGPDFYVLGPPRTATTWLAHHLGRNPDIWMPPVKELHYFDVQKENGINNRYRNLHLAQLSKKRGMSDGEYLDSIDKERASWPYLYLTQPRDDDWYKNLFGFSDKIRGEATPTYLRLPDEEISALLSLNPSAKFILMVRHPMFRLLSLIGKMIRDSGQSVAELGEEKLLGLMAANARTYVGNVERWQERVAPNRFLLVWYEDVQQDSADVLRRVATYLGASAPAEWCDVSVAGQARNASPEWDMEDLSPTLREGLLEASQPDLDFVRAHAWERGKNWFALAKQWSADPEGVGELS